jgi:uncharacterized membrane protein
MEMFIFFAGLIIVLIVSSGLAISILFLGDMNPDSKQNRRVNYTLSDLKDNDNLKKLIAEVKDYKEKVPS